MLGNFSRNATALLFTILSANAALANHVQVNCGTPGFWDHSIVTPLGAPSYYVALMSDSTAVLELPDQSRHQLGPVKCPGDASIPTLALSSLASGNVFSGEGFSLTLNEEILRPTPTKNRRFFRAVFKSNSLSVPQECMFGAK